MEYDVVIVGGGPAGLTSAIYAARRGLSTLVLTKDIGGQITKTDAVENYPGFDHISGTELAMNMFKQAQKFGAKFNFEGAKKISRESDAFSAETTHEKFIAKSIILALGKSPRELNVPGEDRLKGRGVSYCATCDAPFFKDKNLVVVGGGNSALEAILLTAPIAKKVYLVHRSEIRGEAILQEKIAGFQNVEQVIPAEIEQIEGEDRVTGIILKDGKTIKTDGVLVEIGFAIDRTLIENLVEMDEKSQVITNDNQETSVPGIFAAGDITTTAYKQVVVSAGEGAKAALSCFNYIQKLSGKRGITGDWH